MEHFKIFETFLNAHNIIKIFLESAVFVIVWNHRILHKIVLFQDHYQSFRTFQNVLFSSRTLEIILKVSKVMQKVLQHSELFEFQKKIKLIIKHFQGVVS